MTYIPTQAGFLYLADVLDVWSRKIVGWAMSSRLDKEIVLDALQMAVEQRRPAAGVIRHSDQGCQYTSIEFGKRCREAGVRASMGSVGDCYDNAMCESFFATLECELLDRVRFADRADAELAVFDFIEGFYNTHRRHSALGDLAPVIRAEERRRRRSARIASAPDDVKPRCAQLLRFATALRVTSPSAAARCAYAESRAFGAGDAATIIKAPSTRVMLDAQRSTRPRNRGRLKLLQLIDALVERNSLRKQRGA